MEKFFELVERVGNRLPHPFILFLYLCVVVVLFSAFAGWLGWSEFNPKTGEMIVARNIISGQGLLDFVQHMVKNFAHFAPLGLVVVMMMGVSLAEKSGFIETFIRVVIRNAPERLVIPLIVVAGACGNIGSDAGIVIVPPIAAIIFKRMGHHPLVGFVLGYAAATAGFTANLIPAGTDVLLAGITTEVYGSIKRGAEVVATCNWYFMIASTFMLAVVFSWVARKFTIPMCEKYPVTGFVKVSSTRVTRREKWALAIAIALALVYLGILAFTIVPEGGILRHPDPGKFMRSPFFKGLIPILFFLFIIVGYTYGKIVGTIKTSNDVAHAVIASVRSLAPYIALVFMIAQFVAFFKWSYLDQLIAIRGAETLQMFHFSGLPLIISFIVMTALLNLFIGSGSAKWAIMAPIFVTMFYQLGLSPASTQLLYRLGDSATNGISPLYTMFPLMLGWAEQYDEDAGVGTVTGLLMPYAIFALIAWLVLVVIWYLIGLPIGIGETF